MRFFLQQRLCPFGVGFLFLFCLFSFSTQAETFRVCHQYGCKKTVSVELHEQMAQQLQERIKASKTAEEERENLGWAVQQMYELAAKTYPPLRDDKGGNFNDGSSPGRMDCADHSENVDNFLKLFEKRGWLHFHQSIGRKWRAPHFFDLHYTAVIKDLGTGQDWVVDSWFKDFGERPVIVPLTTWKKGYAP